MRNRWTVEEIEEYAGLAFFLLVVATLPLWIRPFCRFTLWVAGAL